MKITVSQSALPSVRRGAGLGATSRWVVFGALGLGLALMGLAFWFAVARPVKVLPRIKPMPAFALEDQYGLPINSSDLAGRTVFINFTYTGCGEACAAQREALAALREALRADGRLGSSVIFLTVSFDPARDTRQALQTYAAQQGADRGSWRFATGDEAELKELIGRGLSFYYGEPGPDGQIKHDQRLVMVDANGILRAKYDATALSTTKLLRDIGLVEQEVGSSGAMRQVYEASHIFLCYPD